MIKFYIHSAPYLHQRQQQAPMKINSSTYFKRFTPGTEFINIKTNKRARLRRRTDPKTLDGTLYLLCEGQDIFEVNNPKDWKPVPVTHRKSVTIATFTSTPQQINE